MENNKKYIKGFSLIEFLIYISILAVVSVSIGGIFIIVNKGGAKAEAQSEVNTSLRYAMARIKQDVQVATAITTSNYDASGNNKIFLTVWGAKITYDTLNGQIRRQVSTGTPESIISNKVSVVSLSFGLIEEANELSAKLIRGVQTNLKLEYNTSNPDLEYSQAKVTTVNPLKLFDLFQRGSANGLDKGCTYNKPERNFSFVSRAFADPGTVGTEFPASPPGTPPPPTPPGC